MSDTTPELFGEPISGYSRRQAIEDGVLVDLMQPATVAIVREAGFKIPVAMTTAAFEATVAKIGEPLPEGQDIKGRLWDVLWMLRRAVQSRRGPSDTEQFQVRVWNGERHEDVRLWSQCGPGDDAAPVVTILLEGED